MALSPSSTMRAAALLSFTSSRIQPQIPKSSSINSNSNSSSRCYCAENLLSSIYSNNCNAAPKTPSFRISADLKARFVARRSETVRVKQLQRPLVEYLRLPASQYSVLDAERIERVDDNTFRCYVYRLKFFSFEICPVLLVRVEEEPNGCCIRLLSCKLEGSPLVVAQNDKFSASMENKISCNFNLGNSSVQQLTSDAAIEVVLDVPFAFRAIPVQMIESTGTQILEQLLKMMLPRFMVQLVKDYQAWASGDTTRQALGTGEI